MELATLIISLLALVVSLVVGYFYLESVREQARKEYQANQPDVQITDLSSMNTGETLTLFPIAQNVSKAPGYNCTLTLDGWQGQIAIGTCYPPGSKFKEHRVSIALSLDTPIRTTQVENARLRIRYSDYWGGQYEVSYPVEQVKQGGATHYTPAIHLESPAHAWPSPGYREIRKLLKNIPSRQW